MLHPLFLLGLLFCALGVYFFLVILSYVMELKRGTGSNHPGIIIQQGPVPQPGTVYVQVPLQEGHSPPPTYYPNLKQEV